MGKVKEFFMDLIEEQMRDNKLVDEEYFYKVMLERQQEEEEHFNNLKIKSNEQGHH